MASFPVRQDYDPRASFSDCARDFQPVLPGVLYAAVGNVERSAPGAPQNLRCGFSLSRSVISRAARTHLTLGQVEDAGALAALRHLQQRAATGLLDVITVGSDCQNVYRILRRK